MTQEKWAETMKRKKGTETKKQLLKSNSPEADYGKFQVTGSRWQDSGGQDPRKQNHGAGDSTSC